MVRFFRDSGLPSRRSREAARRRRRSDRERDLKLESLEPRLALAVMPGLPDMIAPVVRSVTLPAAGTYGTDRALSFKVNFNEPVKVVGDQSAVTLPVEVGYAMHEARYVSGSGTRSLTFRMTVAANDVDTDGISLGRVNSAAVRDFDFAANQILDRAGNPASDVIPAVNTSRIRVDATGPVVASSGDFATKGQQVSLKVTFDGPVTVKGKPTIPVTIGGQDRSLAYAFGSGTKTLTFAVTLPRRASAANPAFRGENGLPGEVIVLPAGADLKDRFGNSVTAVGGNFGKTFTHSGSRVVVIGTHFEKLTFGESDSLSQDDLNTILNDEQLGFLNDGDAEYLKDYAPPVFRSAKNEVELYRVAYRSTIPEQGNRPTVAYGLVAIPKGGTGALPLVCYQHGELLLKESAPSQAFFWDKTDDTTPVRYGLTQKQLYDSAYETRLNVAQFAGNGYAVIAADSFGLGNSVELDSFLAKQSGQQANLDMHAASQKLLQSLALTADKLFLNGWSTGGLATIAFQEALEAEGVKIDGGYALRPRDVRQPDDLQSTAVFRHDRARRPVECRDSAAGSLLARGLWPEARRGPRTLRRQLRLRAEVLHAGVRGPPRVHVPFGRGRRSDTGHDDGRRHPFGGAGAVHRRSPRTGCRRLLEDGLCGPHSRCGSRIDRPRERHANLLRPRRRDRARVGGDHPRHSAGRHLRQDEPRARAARRCQPPRHLA
jgi:hypothetical protein